MHSGRRLVEESDEMLEVGFLAHNFVDDTEQRSVPGVGLDEALDAGDQVGRQVAHQDAVLTAQRLHASMGATRADKVGDLFGALDVRHLFA